MSQAYLVLGTPRSGTTLTAQLMHTMGVNMGTNLEPSDTNWTPHGNFYADLDFKLIHVQMWRHQPVVPQLASNDPLLQQYRALIRQREAKYPQWGIKDHGLVWVLPLILPLFSTPPKLVFTSRTQASSIASWAARKGCTTAEATALIGAYATQIASYSSLGLQSYTLDFDKIIADPSGQVAALASWLGLPVGNAASVVDASWKRF